eukprot:4138-Heterococcus_DN1.PRE.1
MKSVVSVVLKLNVCNSSSSCLLFNNGRYHISTDSSRVLAAAIAACCVHLLRAAPAYDVPC